MSLEIEAVYEDGVLKPERPLPLKEHERVTVSVKPQTSRIRQSAGLLRWTGDPEVLRKIAEDPEFGISESP
jgi:predicted DNA-binding antitoxin AbrB/MazE fold protein